MDTVLNFSVKKLLESRALHPLLTEAQKIQKKVDYQLCANLPGLRPAGLKKVFPKYPPLLVRFNITPYLVITR